MLRTGLVRDFGGGCVGGWEFTVHAPGDDPFISQQPLALPVVVTYRVFLASRAATATTCATMLGLTPPAPTVDFKCADTFVSTMTTL